MFYNYGNTLMFFSNITIKSYNFHIKVSFLLWLNDYTFIFYFAALFKSKIKTRNKEKPYY